jgi:hypothetical protein
MKKYKITNVGCDDMTEGVFEFTEEQYEFLNKTFEELNKNSTYGCMPTIYVEEIHPTEKGGEG